LTRLVLASDTHSSHRYRETYWPEGKILVHAGDVSATGGFGECADFIHWAGHQQYYKEVAFIAGNHDFAFQNRFDELKEILDKYPHVHYLRDSSCEIDGIKFYGTPWQPMFGGMAFNIRFEKELQKYWQQIPKNTDVLITHSPPMNILDVNHFGEKCGSISLLVEVIDRIKPKLHVFGHIHESKGRHIQDGITFVNAAIVPQVIDF